MSVYVNLIRGELRAAGISTSVFAAVAGVKQSTMTAILRETMNVGGPEEARLHTLALRCAAIVDALRPLTLESGDWKPLAKLVQKDIAPEEIAQTIFELFDNSSSQ